MENKKEAKDLDEAVNKGHKNAKKEIYDFTNPEA